MGSIRIGKVASIDYKKGMVKVVYTAKDDASTKLLPVLNFNGEYKMPKLESYVLVAHLSNGTEAGVVLGNFWNKANVPEEAGKEIYRKEFAEKAREAFVRYADKKMEIVAGNIEFTTKNEKISIKNIVDRLEKLEARG